MLCERCGANLLGGHLMVRRTFAGLVCYGCAEEVKRLEWEERNMAKQNMKGKKAAVGKGKPQLVKQKTGGTKATKGSGGTLAAIIDPLLMDGKMTVAEIAAELAKKAGDAAKNRDLAANVRARLVSYTRKGWRVEKDEQKRVKVLQNA